MRLILLLTVLSGIFICCKQQSKQASRFDNILNIDTLCLKQLKKAKTDIEEGKLIYCHFAGSMLYQPLRNAQEMDSLLSKFGIKYTEEITSDVVYKDQTQSCYCDFMRENIDRKFGSGFVDSLLNVSDSLYVVNNSADTFYYANCDTRPNYPDDTDMHNEEYSKILQVDVEKILNYPIGYIKKPNSDSSAFVNVDLYVDKNGNATTTGYWFIFDMKSNHKFEGYFKQIIDKAMRKSGWTPATIRMHKVNSDMVMRLYFD